MIIGRILLQKRQLLYNQYPNLLAIGTSLAMVPTRVKGRGSFSRDRLVALARTLAQETGYIFFLQMLK